jgi:Zn-finger nucleic acid-binding protein
MASEIPHKINKTLLGKLHVKYDCPKCKLELENPLNEAGRSDTCPECGTVFVVPGESAQKEMEQQRLLAKNAATEEAERNAQIKLEREQAKQQSRAEEQRKQQVEQIQREEQRKRQADQKQLEQQRRLAQELAQSEIQSGYDYHVETFLPTVKDCSQNLTKFIRFYSEKGWEYVDFNIVSVYDPPGCIAGLLGLPGQNHINHLVIFRKPKG